MVFFPDHGVLATNLTGFSGAGARPGSGTFQPTAQGASTIVNANVPASANVVFEPGNAAAGVLLRTKTCSVATGNSAGSFVFNVSATALGAPVGTETFLYFFTLENPS